jgi:hypothetical protein
VLLFLKIHNMHLAEHATGTTELLQVASYSSFRFIVILSLARSRAEGCVLVWSGQRRDCLCLRNLWK